MAFALCVLFGVAACGDSDISAEKNQNSSSTPDTWTPEGPDGASADAGGDGATSEGGAVALETRLPRQTLPAGSTLQVECQPVDAQGNDVSLEEEVEFGLQPTPPEHFETPSSQTLEARIAGEAEVACIAPSLNLVDSTPAELTVTPGPAAVVRTELDKSTVRAGTTVTATCRAYDAFGNRIRSADPEVRVDATGGGITIEDRDVTVEPTGIYQVTCHIDGADRETGATLEVQPGLPADLAVTPKPQRPVYVLGQVVRLQTLVSDQYGNRIDQAEVNFKSQPQGPSFGYGRYRFDKEGTYQITATVQGKTYKDRDLSKSVQIVVNGDGPEIECRDPAAGEALDRNPGTSLTFRGKVGDPNGVQTLTVNGQTVSSIQNDGTFDTSLSPEFGINFVDITATDSFGEENSRTCAFLIADQWNDSSQHLDDAVSMRLAQKGLDDGNRQDELDSLADLFVRVLNSKGLERRLARALLKANPLRKDSPRVKYKPKKGRPPAQGIRIRGVKNLDLDWTNRGLEMDVTLDKVEVRIEADQDKFVPFGSITETGWVKTEGLGLSFEASIGLKNNQLTASVIQPTVQARGPTTIKVDLGNAVANFVINAVKSLFKGSIQNLIQNELESYVKNDLDKVLDNLFSSLSINSLGRTVQVPKVTRSGTIPLNFGVQFASTDFQPSRALVGIGTRFRTSNIQRPGTAKGVPLQRGSIRLEPSTNRAIAVGIHLGVINQVLYTLWRSGLFDANIGSSLLGSSAPQGTQAELGLGLPPVAVRRGSNDQVELMLGGATLQLVYPGIFDKPVRFDVGLVARTKASIQGRNTLKFSNIKLVDFYFSPRGGISLSSKTRSTVESFLKDLFQNVVDRSLNQSIPALPIPSFDIPSSFGKYNLPTNKKLGINKPGLDLVRHHVLLEGNFGLQ